MNKYLLSALLALFAAVSTPCLAVPEVAHNGYFTCNSCHVSPGGGGLLNNYGRDFSAEKLSTWSFENEQNPGQGLLPLTEMFLLGGDARWVEYSRKMGDNKDKKFWRMQTDIEAGVHVGPVWFTGAMGTEPAGPVPNPDAKKNLIVRSFASRVDLFDEHVMVRAGLFIPKFGLMLQDHTAFVRAVTGLDPNSAEQTQIEALYQDEMFEVSAAGLIANENFDRAGKTRSGYNLGASTFLQGRHRFNVNLLSTTQKIAGGSEARQLIAGMSGIVTLHPRVFTLFEFDRIANENWSGGALSSKATAFADFVSFNVQLFRGLIAFLRYEYYDSDIGIPDTSVNRWGGGFTSYPTPHVQLEVRLQRATQPGGGDMTDEANGVLHYYF